MLYEVITVKVVFGPEERGIQVGLVNRGIAHLNACNNFFGGTNQCSNTGANYGTEAPTGQCDQI